MARRPGSNWLLSIVSCLALAVTGCNLGRPNWLHPGTIATQQQRATYHDPYADNDAAPAVVARRPRDFERPATEPTRSQPWKYWYGQ